jgi:hypothetical protein
VLEEHAGRLVPMYDFQTPADRPLEFSDATRGDRDNLFGISARCPDWAWVHRELRPGPPLQQRRVRNDRLVRAGVAARAHQVEDAQVLEAEGVTRRHGRACSFLPASV